MDGVGDELATIDAVDNTHLQSKDGEYSRKADNAGMMESHEMMIPSERECHGGSSPSFTTILEGKNPDRGCVSERPSASIHCVDDAGVMAEELTLQNFKNESIAIVSTSSNRDAIISNAWEDVGYTVFPELLGPKPPDDVHIDNVEHVLNNESKAVASNPLAPPGGIRTKILSKSGFSEYFVKNTLKSKGVIFKGPAREGFGAVIRGQTDSKASSTAMVAFNAPLSSSTKTVVPPSHDVARPGLGPSLNAFHDGVSLREWLKAGQYKANKVNSFHIFRQIVGLVDISHAKGVALQDLRPSCFNLLPSNQVIYLGSYGRHETAENSTDQDSLLSENDRNEKRPLEQAMHPAVSERIKKQKFGENLNFIRQWHQLPSRSSFKTTTANDTDVSIAGPKDSWNELNKEHNLRREYKSESNYSRLTPQLRSTYASDPLEEKKWYTSPEELSGKGCTFSSNIYILGVLLFELLSPFHSERELAAAMSDLHYRILPPNFLSKNPKEAGFCLWLLHPEPSLRPTAREVLQSDVISGVEESFGDKLSSSIDQDDAESELLLHFLFPLEEQMHKDALKLVEEIKYLEADIEEVQRRQTKKSLVLACSSKESLHPRGSGFCHREHSSFEVHYPVANNELKLMKNISQLESVYFSTRSNIQISNNDVTTRANKELLKDRANGYRPQKDEEKNKPIDCLGAFFSGFCKYARYNKFEVRGILRNGDFHNSANVICSLSFDRGQDYFANAGVSKKIKIYEFYALFNDAVDIHYPVIEMSNKSRLSCICWNSYIRNYLASTDYAGIVKVDRRNQRKNVLLLAYQSFGIVHGDLSTGPLYVYTSTFSGRLHNYQTEDAVFGVFSLIFWSLTLLLLLKFVIITLNADDNGEGGPFALYSLLCRHTKFSLLPNHQAADEEISTYHPPGYSSAHSVIMACNNKKPIQDQLVLERGSSNKVKNTSVARGRRTGYGVIIDLDDSDDEMPTKDGTTSVPNVVASGFILSDKEIGSAHFHQTGDENARSCTENRLLDSSTKRKRGPCTNIDVSKNDDDVDDDMTPINKLKTKATRELITDGGDGSDSADSSSDIESTIKKLRSRNDDNKTWLFAIDMISAFQNDPKLCMNAVCALYRQQLREGQSVNGSSLTKNQGFTAFDLMRGTAFGEYLTAGDPQRKLNKSVAELQQYDPQGLDYCRKLAMGYSHQLFEIHHKEEDPFFLPT